MKRLLPLALALALLAGCAPTAAETPAPVGTPSAAPTQAPAPVSSALPVYTDYSQLTPYEKPEQPIAKFTRRYADFTDTLIPADDYGPLIPFPGVTVARNDADPYWDRWGDDYLYGLMTLNGEVVVDPVFSSAYAASYWDEISHQTRELDCLVLRKVVKDKNGEPIEIAALCARDGSWCTGFDYVYDWELFTDRSQEDVIPMRRRRDLSQSLSGEGLVFLDVHTGKELKTVKLDNLLAQFPDLIRQCLYSVRYEERYCVLSDDAKRYVFDTETGEIRPLENTPEDRLIDSYAGSFSEGLCQREAASGWGYVDASGSWVIDPVYADAYGFQNGVALVRDDEEGGNYKYIDHSGKTVYTFPKGAVGFSSEGNYISYTVDGQKYFLDRDWNSVSATLPEDFTNASVEGYWFYQDMPDSDSPELGSCAFWDPRTGTRLDFPGLRQSVYTVTDGYTLLDTPADLTRDEQGYLVCYDDHYTLLHLPTGKTTDLGRWEAVHLQRDGVTGELYLYLMDPNGHRYEYRTLEGKPLYRTDNPGFWPTGLFDRRAFDAKENVVTLTDLATGELLFSWPLHPAVD